jgi:serine/threonine protein kinase/WD40 repeat protein
MSPEDPDLRFNGAEYSSDEDDDRECLPDESVHRLREYDEHLRRGEYSTAIERCGNVETANSEESALYACLDLLSRAWPRQTSAEGSEFPSHIGRFRLEKVLGMGGFGIVYLAHDTVLKRPVALKVPRLHSLANPNLRERFQREARAAAALDHPQIVPIHETGEVGPVCYIASAFCPGPNLAEWLKSQTTLIPVDLAVELVRELAEAVDYSHSQGVLHRDLKPSNVLLTPCAPERPGGSKSALPFVPRLTDFGLAKLLHEDMELTAATVIAGTPVYMAPEQTGAAFGPIGPATDVYGLGAIMYELLTGRPPFQGSGVAEVLDLVRNAEPVAPRALRANIPRDVEVTCLKCLEKRPGDRIESPRVLAGELECILDGRPIRTRPSSFVRRGFKLLKRHPAEAVALASLIFAIAFGAASGTWYTMSINEAQRELDSKKKEVESEQEKGALRQALLLAAGVRERSQSRPRSWTRQNLADLKTAARFAGDDEFARSLRSEAVRALSAVELELAATAATELDAYGLLYSRDGRYLAAGNNITSEEDDTFVRLIDCETRQEVRRFTLPAPADPLPTDKPEGVRSILFAPDRQSLLIGTRRGRIGIVTLANGECEWTAQPHKGGVIGLGVVEKWNVLATLGEDNWMQLWRWPPGESHQAAIAFSKCESLAVADDRIFVAADEQLQTFRSHVSYGLARDDSATIAAIPQLALLPDRRVAVARSVPGKLDELIFFDSNSNSHFRTLFDTRRKRIHDGELHSLTVSADGRWLISTAGDGLKLWDLTSGEIVASLPNAANRRVSAAFDPIRPEFAVSRDGCVEIWRIALHGVWDSTARQSFAVTSIDLSPDGRYLAVSTARDSTMGQGGIALADVARDTIHFERRISNGPIHPVAISPDNRFLAYNENRDFVNRISLVDTIARQPDVRVTAPQKEFRKPIFAKNHTQLWFTGDSLDIDVGFIASVPIEGDAARGVEIWRWSNDESAEMLRKSSFLSMAVGARLAAASSIDETVRLFAAGTGELLQEVNLRPRIVDRLALSADERWIICGTRQGELLSLTPDGGRVAWSAMAHADAITALCLGPGGLTFSASRDGTLAAWQLDRGELVELFRVGPFHSSILDLDISDDESLVAILFENETGVRLLKIAALREKLKHLGLNW